MNEPILVCIHSDDLPDGLTVLLNGQDVTADIYYAETCEDLGNAGLAILFETAGGEPTKEGEYPTRRIENNPFPHFAKKLVVGIVEIRENK